MKIHVQHTGLFNMKPSETLRIMREKLATVPPELINLVHYRSDKYNRRKLFHTPTDCSTHGCVLGWAATVPELAPLESEYYTVDRFHAHVLDWTAYAQRILGLGPLGEWQETMMYRVLFHSGAYPAENPHAQKKEILRRLALAEYSLARFDEDMELAERYFGVEVFADMESDEKQEYFTARGMVDASIKPTPVENFLWYGFWVTLCVVSVAGVVELLMKIKI